MTPGDTVETIPQADFGKDGSLKRTGTVAVLFHTDWCGYCRAFIPDYLAFARQHPEAVWAFADISDDDTDPRWDDFRIKIVPSIVLFKDGKELARRDGRRGYGLDERDLDMIVTAARESR